MAELSGPFSGLLERLEKAEEAILGVTALAERVAKLEADNISMAPRLARAEKWIADAAKGQFDPDFLHKALGFKA